MYISKNLLYISVLFYLFLMACIFAGSYYIIKLRTNLLRIRDEPNQTHDNLQIVTIELGENRKYLYDALREIGVTLDKDQQVALLKEFESKKIEFRGAG